MTNRKLTLSTLVAFSVFGSIGAQAHVSVWPRESMAGGFERYTVRVPTEGKVPTVSAEMEAPEGVVIEEVAVPNGWKQDLKMNGDQIVGITWTMNIGPKQFAEFAFVARNPRNKTEVVWKLKQRFADGTVTDWTVGPNGTYPTATTKLTPRPEK